MLDQSPKATVECCGLSDAEAAARLQREGPNELPSGRRRAFLAIALEVVREPMFVLLLGGGAIYLLLGEPRDAVLLLSFVLLIMATTLYQERKTERALEALRDLSSPRALVFVGASSSASPAATSCAATCWCWPRAIASPPTRC
jgi:Ca2+-transporting ATPase